jgi:hypothetical protein
LASGSSGSTNSGGAWNFCMAFDNNSLFSDESVNSSVQCSSVSSYRSNASLSSLPTVVFTQPTVTTPSTETLEAVRAATIGKKAVRADNAVVPIVLWDSRVA